jgi:hypothetical protein
MSQGVNPSNLCIAMQFAILGKFATYPYRAGSKFMSQDRMMQAIGRIERALARLENVELTPPGQAPENSELTARHESLKAETRAAIGEIDRLLAEVKG